jgi:hypothetical protein
MFPHADTIYTIHALDYEERLRHAASQRLAASVHTGGHSHAGVSWLGGALSRLHGAIQGLVARPLTTGSPEPVHRVI